MQEKLKSKWNTKLLPLLMEQDEVSLYDIVKLISTEYISAIKYLADFLDYFIYQPDNSLTQEQNNLVLKFIETLTNPYNFKDDSSKSIKAFHKFNIKENLSSENYTPPKITELTALTTLVVPPNISEFRYNKLTYIRWYH